MSKYNVNQIIIGKVNAIKPYGIFVVVDDIYTGLIHISQINGKYINDINDYFKVGDEIKVRVIEVDEDKKQLKLSTVNLLKNKTKRSKLTETSLGFELFDEILQDWIDEKLNEIEKNK
ncbi:MAG: S1 RNA-binding domain-containing protein [Bacilli bacterium]|nr:S1 RNA-binding domain-containing protein [Bacilli bacterium]MBO6195580.1 S1 RNA-binding domain-containing protein [Bacilli bacterium]